MDWFKFVNPVAKTKMSGGDLIGKAESKVWVERYRDADTFEILADQGSPILTQLPEGTFISHTDTEDIMIVENHELQQERSSDSFVKISGRSVETWLENRIVGSNHAYPLSVELEDYTLPAWKTWTQAESLIKRHILAEFLVDNNDALPFFEVVVLAAGSGEEEERVLKRGPVYSELLSILEVDDVGIKIVRPGPWSPAENPVNTAIVIHRGHDHSGTTMFSYEEGDIDSAQYFWSNRKYKNCAYVHGKWLDTRIDLSPTGYDRRMMIVDASDIDEKATALPTGTPRAWYIAAMRARGKQALAAQKRISLVKVDVAGGVEKAIFRQDYHIGDIITVRGNFGEVAKYRVTEYAEIEDNSGASGHPTLTAIGESE